MGARTWTAATSGVSPIGTPKVRAERPAPPRLVRADRWGPGPAAEGRAVALRAVGHRAAANAARPRAMASPSPFARIGTEHRTAAGAAPEPCGRSMKVAPPIWILRAWRAAAARTGHAATSATGEIVPGCAP